MSKSDNFEKINDDTYLSKMKLVLNQAIPAIFCYLADRMQPIINQIFIGHYTKSGNVAMIMAGVGMGDMLTNIMGRSVLNGLNSALDTLVA